MFEPLNTLYIYQGSKLGGARSPGLAGIFPQISAGSSKMYWFLYTTPQVTFEDAIGLPRNKT